MNIPTLKKMTTYNFSITKGSLFPEDSWHICMDYLETKDWNQAKALSKSNSIFNTIKEKTFDTKYGLIKSRIDIFPIDLWAQMTEYEDFVNLLYVSACLRHQILGDFVIEVVREQHLIMQRQLSEDHYRTFMFRKMDDHPEVEKLQEYTLSKIRQTMLRVLSEVDIIESTKNWSITKPLLSDFLCQLLKDQNKNYLKFFIMTDFEIESI